MSELREAFPDVAFVHYKDVYQSPPIEDFLGWIRVNANDLPLSSDTRCIIFTSGTTGKPKGVRLSYSNYTCNRYTFEQFLELQDAHTDFVAVVVNPLHHTNSTSISDWALRRSHTTIHLVEKYTSQYWAVVAAAVAEVDVASVLEQNVNSHLQEKINALSLGRKRRVLVSRHVDFLESLVDSKMLCMSPDLLSLALRECILLLGSAPVGPSTVQRVQKYTQNNLPIVRFGSTETTLQVCGIPYAFPADAILLAFKRGWEHHVVNSAGEVEASVGYYIGQQHAGFTEVKVVRSVERSSPLYMQECVAGQIGHIVTRGGHIMQGYTNAATGLEVINEDLWYQNLGDMGFYLVNPFNHQQDLYWQSRDSQMLIRGGANYAYEQVNSELSSFLSTHFNVPNSAFKLAVCGVKLHSEHEDSCCVMIQVLDDAIFFADKVSEVETSFVAEAKKKVSKGAKPDYVAFGEIPVVQSKGVINIPEMILFWKHKHGL